MEKLIYFFAAIWNLLLLAAAFLTLLGFLYRAYFRKILRARRIARFGERRLLREAAERQGKLS
jgi:hypothetical protein